MKKCPFCAEEIQDEAIKCKHCGEWLKEDTDKQIEENKKEDEKTTPLEREISLKDSDSNPSLTRLVKQKARNSQ